MCGILSVPFLQAILTQPGLFPKFENLSTKRRGTWNALELREQPNYPYNQLKKDRAHCLAKGPGLNVSGDDYETL